MIKFNLETKELGIEGLSGDILCELILLISIIHQDYEEHEKGEYFRTKIIESLYDEELKENTKKIYK